MSETIGKIAEALAAAQGEIEAAVRDSENPFYDSTYADLASCYAACRPQLAKNKIAVCQIPEQVEGLSFLTTMLMHSSGEWLRGTMRIYPMKQIKGQGWVFSPDPQALGTCITYIRRYCLCAMCGVAPEDDDGNAASCVTKKQGKETVYNVEGLNPAQCDYCGKQIFWIKTASGKNAPVEGDGKVHFGRCPKFDEHKKEKAATTKKKTDTKKTTTKKAEPVKSVKPGDIKPAQRSQIFAIVGKMFMHGSKMTKEEDDRKMLFLHWIQVQFFHPDGKVGEMSMTTLDESQADKLITLLTDEKRRSSANEKFVAWEGGLTPDESTAAKGDPDVPF